MFISENSYIKVKKHSLDLIKLFTNLSRGNFDGSIVKFVLQQTENILLVALYYRALLIKHCCSRFDISICLILINDKHVKKTLSLYMSFANTSIFLD